MELAQYNNKFLPEEAIAAAGLVGPVGPVGPVAACSILLLCTVLLMHPRMCNTASGLAFGLFWPFVLPFETSMLLFRLSIKPCFVLESAEWCLPGDSLQALPRIHRLRIPAGDVQACGLHACQRHGGV